MRVAKLLGKIIGYAIAGVLAFVILLVLALNLLLQSTTFTGFVLSRVLPIVNESLQTQIGVDKLSISFFPVRVRISGAYLTPPKGEFKHRFAELKNLEVDARFLPLLTGRVVVDRVLIDGASNYLCFDRNGLANLPFPPSNKPDEPSKGPPDLKLPIEARNIEIRNVQFFMDMDSDPEKAGPEMEVSVLSIGVAAKGDMNTGETSAKVRIADGHFRQDELAETLKQFNLDATFNLLTWGGEVDNLQIRIPDVSIDGRATAKNVVTDILIAADIEGKIDIGKVNKLFIPQPELAGELTLRAHADLPIPKYNITAEIGLEGGRVNRLPIEKLALSAALDPDKAVLRNLLLKAAGGEISAKGDLGLKDKMPLSASVGLSGLNIGPALEGYGLKGIGAAGVVGGTITVDGRLGGEDMEVAARTNLGVSGAAYSDVVKVSQIGIDTDVAWSPKILDVRQAIITTTRTRIEASGKMGIKDLDLGFKYLVDAKDLSEFSPIAGNETSGSVRVEGDVKGKASAPNVDAKLAVLKARFGKFGIDEVAATAGMAGKKIKLDELLVRNGNAQVKASGEMNLDGKTPSVDAGLLISKSPIHDLLAAGGQGGLDVQGDLTVDAHVSGPIDELGGEAKILLSPLNAYGEDVEKIELDASLLGGGVDLKKLLIVKLAPPRPGVDMPIEKALGLPRDQWRETKIQAKGTFDPKTGKLALEMNSEGLSEQSSGILRKKKIPLTADVELALRAGGTISDPEVDLDLAVANAVFDNMILGNSALKVRLADQKVRVTGRLLADREKMPESLRPAEEGAWNIRRLNTEREPPLEHPLPPEKIVPGTEAGGPEDFTKGAEEKPAEPPGAEAPAGPWGSIKIDVEAGLTGEKTVKGEILFDKFDYSGFLVSLREQGSAAVTQKLSRGGEGEEIDIVEGRISGRVDLGGSLAKVSSMTVKMDLDELYFRKKDLIIRNQGERGAKKPIRVSYEGGRLNVESFDLGGRIAELRLRKTDEGFLLDLRANLAVVQQFTNIFSESKGVIEVTATIPEDLNPDQATARVKMDNGSISIQGVPTPVERLNILADFRNGELKIDRLDAKIGPGAMTGGGRILLPKTKDDTLNVQVFTKLRGVKTGKDPYLELALKTVDIYVNTVLEGEHKGKLDVTGEVVIDRAAFTQSFDIVTVFTQLADIGRKKGSAGAETYKEKQESVFFNIAVRADRDVGVVSNVAEINTSLDLVLVGSNTAPGMRGSVDILEGWAVVLRNKYTVNRGTIQFFDENRIFPSFDINSETEIKGSKIFVSISGNPIDYKLVLSSEPPMTERDIFMMLATGASYEEFSAKGGTAAVGEEAAAAAAQQLIGSQLGKLTGGASGFEVGFDSSSGTSRLKISSEIEKDLYLSMYRGLVDQTLGAELQYDFYRYVAAQGTWSNMAGYPDVPSAGAYGGGLLFKITFQ